MPGSAPVASCSPLSPSSSLCSAVLPVAFKTYQYALSLTDSLVVCVKSNLD